jgi:hypothetical protein
MLLAGLTAFATMMAATALCALDTGPGRAVLYAVARYRRHQRTRRAR